MDDSNIFAVPALIFAPILRVYSRQYPQKVVRCHLPQFLGQLQFPGTGQLAVHSFMQGPQVGLDVAVDVGFFVVVGQKYLGSEILVSFLALNVRQEYLPQKWAHLQSLGSLQATRQSFRHGPQGMGFGHAYLGSGDRR